ncbi:MAG TPA: Hsp20/alpha crystallin family protein [Flavitalea sp.]|nr:Hsp20/alpha crystallin family protein [Flavitalea sp.]
MKDTTIAKRQNEQQAATFGNVVDNIFQNSLQHFFDDNYWDTGGYKGISKVPVNIRETEDQYQLDVVAPGYRKEGFNIQVEGNMLTVSYNYRDENHDQSTKDKWVRNEYVPKAFSRNFTIDDTVDVNNINACYVDGILRLSMAKNEKAKTISRNIQIQ